METPDSTINIEFRKSIFRNGKKNETKNTTSEINFHFQQPTSIPPTQPKKNIHPRKHRSIPTWI